MGYISEDSDFFLALTYYRQVMQWKTSSWSYRVSCDAIVDPSVVDVVDEGRISIDVSKEKRKIMTRYLSYVIV